MGIKYDNKIKYLIKLVNHKIDIGVGGLKAIINPVNPTNKANNNLHKKLNYKSILPILLLGSLEFISILVSFPQYITYPKIFPEAKIMLAQIVFSKDKDSFLALPLLFLALNTPKNS